MYISEQAFASLFREHPTSHLPMDAASEPYERSKSDSMVDGLMIISYQCILGERI
jgi:hypothetical protein